MFYESIIIIDYTNVIPNKAITVAKLKAVLTKYRNSIIP